MKKYFSFNVYCLLIMILACNCSVYADGAIEKSADYIISGNLSSNKFFNNGVLAYTIENYVKAKELLEKAILSQEDSDLFYQRGIKIRPMAYYLLGESRGALGEFKEAREAYEKMVEISPEYVQPLNTEVGSIIISAARAQVQISACYMKEHEVDKGLQAGLKALQAVQRYIPGDIHTIGYIHYTIACAYALKGDRESALKHVMESLNSDPSLKADILKDKDLKILHEDEVFKELTK